MCPLCCPQCGSNRVCRDGQRYLKDGSVVQRWLCKSCANRFSQPSHHYSTKSEHAPMTDTQTSNRSRAFTLNCQVCDLAEESKNLNPTAEIKTVAGESPQDSKGKIVEFSFWMLKQGYSKGTIQTRTKILKRLVKLETDIFNPESVKETIAKQEWSTGRKCIAVDAYTCFLQM